MRPNVGILRSAAARWLTEQGEVWRPGEGPPVRNPETGEMVPPPPVLVFSGPILVRPQSNAERVVETAGASSTVTRYDVTLPAGTPVRIGHTVKATDAPFDPALVGVALTVLDVPLDAWQVARHCVAAMVT